MGQVRPPDLLRQRGAHTQDGRVFWRKRGRDLFRPYESAVLDAVRARLQPAAVELFDRQIDAVEMIQRLQDDREVNVYPNRRGPQRHDPANDWPNKSTELRLASVTTIGPGGTGKANLYAVQGHFFEIAFKPGPKQLRLSSAIEVRVVRVSADLMIDVTDGGVDQLIGEMDPATRTDLEGMWADGSADRLGLASRGEVYRIQLVDGDHAVLTQLDDTSFLVAPIDPLGLGVKRFWPDGDVMREYPDIRSALHDR